jgi:hypothetical protein
MKIVGCLMLGLWCGVLVSEVRGAEVGSAVTLRSLLLEMADRDAVAQWPSPAYTLLQASSHDPRKNDPGNAETWHSNTDHGQFLHTELNEGRREWVIMEDDGPGAIVRYWTPLLADKESQIIRFYFDGSPTPAIAAKLNDLFRGCDFVRPPFAFVSWNETDLRNQMESPRKDAKGVGGDLYLPIPYARSCKITLDSVPFYYVINFRSYEPGTRVETFTMAGYEAAKDAVAQAAEELLGTTSVVEPGRGGTRPSHAQATIASGAELALDLPAGAAAVRELSVQIDPADAPQVLRSTILQATFDDETAIWCPLGEFFGAGARLNPVRDWWRSVGADGALASRWVMPYRRAGRLSLKNLGGKPVTVTLTADVRPWRWDDRSLHFRANWRCQPGIKTRPMADWNYIEVQGQGRYAGDTLTVFSPAREWYGEGDERIYVDGATFPAHIGTGTEDYYGYAWGMAGCFSSPFISVPQRDAEERDNWTGYTTTSRLRPLDSIPFRTALKIDMEIWNWADTQVDYAVGTFWYARPGATHNREPQPQEAAIPVRALPGEFRIEGAVECETMALAAKSPDLKVEAQNAGLREGQWSGGRQLFVQATNVGAFVELAVPVQGDRSRAVTLYGTKSHDYGILRFAVNGQPAGSDYDAYRPEAAASGPIELGSFEPKDGKFLLRAEVVGANPESKGPRYFFGLDCVVFK